MRHLTKYNTTMPSVDVYNLGQKPVKSSVAINDSEAYVSYIQGDTTLISGSETHRLEPPTNSSEIGCLGGKSPRSLERWNNEVRDFQKAKRESLRNAIPDYHQWKQRLRLDLEADLSRRTQEAVQIPPRERLKQMRMEYEARESQRELVGQLHREELILMQNKVPHNLYVSKQKNLVVQKPNTLDPKLHPVARKQQKRRQWELRAHHSRELVTVIKPNSKEMGKVTSNGLLQLDLKDKEPADSTESDSDTLRCDESQASNPEKLPQTFDQVDQLSYAPSDSTISEITKRARAVLQRRRFSIGTCSHWLTGETPTTNRDSLGYPRSVGSILSCLCDTEYDGLSWHIAPNRQAIGDPFCFEWDASAAPDVYRLSKGLGSLFTDADKEVMMEIERFTTTKRTSFNWTTRQALLQRLQQLTREEKQVTGDPEECLISSWFVPQVVYDCETSARWTPAMLEAMGMSSQLGNPRQFISWVPPSLVFESRFEGGNLRQARR
ncbi:hypothetical protein CSKR_109827, partial [Clonorchis sinensis]